MSENVRGTRGAGFIGSHPVDALLEERGRAVAPHARAVGLPKETSRTSDIQDARPRPVTVLGRS